MSLNHLVLRTRISRVPSAAQLCLSVCPRVRKDLDSTPFLYSDSSAYPRVKSLAPEIVNAIILTHDVSNVNVKINTNLDIFTIEPDTIQYICKVPRSHLTCNIRIKNIDHYSDVKQTDIMSGQIEIDNEMSSRSKKAYVHCSLIECFVHLSCHLIANRFKTAFSIAVYHCDGISAVSM